jgi:hypothetical protein
MRLRIIQPNDIANVLLTSNDLVDRHAESL